MLPPGGRQPTIPSCTHLMNPVFPQDVEGAYRLIGTELIAMEELTRLELSSVDPFVDEIVRYSLRFGGKRLRPALLFLAGKTLGPLNSQHLHAAAAVELVHTATLIHDDILDGAAVRRHLATMNVRWDAQVAVLAGDLLLTRAMELMTRLDDRRGLRMLSEACKKTCEGELRQIGTVGRFEMSQDEYFEMIAGKTAPLLACSAQIGALYSGVDKETVERFHRFGHRLGLAFQIVDDVLDLVGETNTVGKTLRTDLENRKPTLPLILYLQHSDGETRRKMLSMIGEKNFSGIVAVLDSSGMIDAARKEAETLTEQAIEEIKPYGTGEAVAGLTALARFIVKRND